MDSLTINNICAFLISSSFLLLSCILLAWIKTDYQCKLYKIIIGFCIAFFIRGIFILFYYGFSKNNGFLFEILNIVTSLLLIIVTLYTVKSMPTIFNYFKIKQSEINKNKIDLYEMELLLDSLPAMSWVSDNDGIHSYFSKKWEEYSGLEQEQLKGEKWMQLIHPDDKYSLLNNWYTCLHNGTDYKSESRIRDKRGKYRWFLTRAYPLKINDKIIKWFGTCVDIDDYKKDHEIFSSLKSITSNYL